MKVTSMKLIPLALILLFSALDNVNAELNDKNQWGMGHVDWNNNPWFRQGHISHHEERNDDVPLQPSNPVHSPSGHHQRPHHAPHDEGNQPHSGIDIHQGSPVVNHPPASNHSSKPEPNPMPNLDTLPQQPSYEKFCQAVDIYSITQWGGHPPKPSMEVYAWYQDIVARALSLEEQAMFLANIIWETAGLQYREELACRKGDCEYGKYFGRGYIQLTWDYNYRDASYDLFGDDTLIKHPELVADVEGGWRTAMWYWNKHVAPRLRENDAIRTFSLGYAVMAINGAVECTSYNKKFDRLKIYNAILAAWGIDYSSPGRMTGCYPEKINNKDQETFFEEKATLTSDLATAIQTMTGSMPTIAPN